MGEEELRVSSFSQFSQSVTFAVSVPVLSVNSRGEILILLFSFSGI